MIEDPGIQREWNDRCAEGAADGRETTGAVDEGKSGFTRRYVAIPAAGLSFADATSPLRGVVCSAHFMY